MSAPDKEGVTKWRVHNGDLLDDDGEPLEMGYWHVVTFDAFTALEAERDALRAALESAAAGLEAASIALTVHAAFASAAAVESQHLAARAALEPKR